MKRLLLLQAITVLGAFAVACGGGDDGGNGGGNGNGNGDGNGDGGNAGTPGAINVTITDTGITVDPPSSPAGATAFNVTNQGTKPHSFYLIQWDKGLEAVPVDADGTVDVLTGAIKVTGFIAELPPGETRNKNIVTFKGKAVVFSNEPGDYAAGLRAEFTGE